MGGIYKVILAKPLVASYGAYTVKAMGATIKAEASRPRDLYDLIPYGGGEDLRLCIDLLESLNNGIFNPYNAGAIVGNKPGELSLIAGTGAAGKGIGAAYDFANKAISELNK